jgi:lipopolysaccharide assembly outer membrane protein LptD (OstA)
VIKGDVKLERADVTILTPEIRYFHKENALVAPEDVLLESAQARVTGKNLQIDLTKKRLVMKQHRLTTVKLEKGLL